LHRSNSLKLLFQKQLPHKTTVLCVFCQVAAEGLKRTLNIPNFWSSLTNTERIDTLSHIKQLFDIWIPKPDAFILIKLLQTAANKAVIWSACQSRYLKYFLQVCVKCLPEMKESELGMI
jgi:hypothetical protein